MTSFALGNGAIWNGDCLELMKYIPSGSVDMILCDLPYGTTACKWDTIIPFEPLWEQYWRVAKPNAAIVLTASQPFTTALISSQLDNFKYCWVWVKSSATGFVNAKKQPLRKTEDVCIFGNGQSIYNPQNLIYAPKNIKNGKSTGGKVVQGENIASKMGGLRTPGNEYIQEFTNYPNNILEVNTERGLHPTQKPVALFEYLIKTYTNPGETVLDNCSGSGTTAIAAQRTGRRFICIEKDPVYYMGSTARLWKELNS